MKALVSDVKEAIERLRLHRGASCCVVCLQERELFEHRIGWTCDDCLNKLEELEVTE